MRRGLLLAVAVLVAAAPLQVVCQSDTDPPTLTPVEQTVVEGESAEFTCSPLPDRGSSVLNTFAPGSESSEGLINSDSRISISDNRTVDPNFRIFTWLNASRDDNGRRFFCAALGMSSSESTLYVNYGVTISIGETMFIRMVGESLEVVISVDGRPTPTLQWTLNGNTIGNTSNRALTSTGLGISSVAVEDAGEYVVNATNDVNSTSVSFVLIVRHAPVFTKGTGTVALSLPLGGSGIINCSSISFPSLINTTLSRSGTPIELGENNTFTILNATDRNAGNYTCTATNEIGNTTLTVDVQVGSAPGTVRNIRLDEQEDDNKLTILWDAANDNGVRITSYEVVIEYEDEKIMDTVSPPSLSYTVTREDLDIPKEGKEIMIKITITAVNGVGSGEEVSFDTTAKFDSITSSSLLTLPCAIILMTCTALTIL